MALLGLLSFLSTVWCHWWAYWYRVTLAVDAVHWWWWPPDMIVKRFGCTVHKKALHKCLIHPSIHPSIQSSNSGTGPDLSLWFLGPLGKYNHTCACINSTLWRGILLCFFTNFIIQQVKMYERRVLKLKPRYYRPYELVLWAFLRYVSQTVYFFEQVHLNRLSMITRIKRHNVCQRYRYELSVFF